MNNQDTGVYRTYLRDLKAICHEKQFSYTAVRLWNGFDIPIVKIRPERPVKTLLVLAGLHGDERSPVYAVKEFLSEYTIKDTRLLVFPCMNPWGFVHNTRKNDRGYDLNRLRNSQPIQEEQVILFQRLFNVRFDGVLSMHEDSATHKVYFYAYEREQDRVYRWVQAEAGKHMTLNLNDRIDGNTADRGIIYDQSDASLESFFRSAWVPVVLCLEVGGREEFGVRVGCDIEMLRHFVNTAA